MADYRHILFEASEGIATVTLNRPDKLNAYLPEMGDEIVDAFARVRDDAELRVAILTGAGRGFCAGVDLERLKQSKAAVEAAGRRLGEEPFLTSFPLELASFPKPVIAALNGAAIGVGVTMVLPCDVRIAAESAKLGLTFAKLGLLPGLGSTHLLPRIVGLPRALELVLTARVVPASEALAMGLVNQVVPDDALAKSAREMARMMADCRPEVLAAAKAALLRGAAGDMEQAMRHEAEASRALRQKRGR